MYRVMLVDDEPSGLEALQLLIDWPSEGFRVCAVCGNGEEALARWRAAQPDLIVTDLRMPRVDGLTLMRRARADGYRGLIMVASGISDNATAQEAQRNGGAGFLLMPVDPAEAAEALERARTELVERELGEGRALPFAPWQQAMSALLMGEGGAAGLPTGGQWRLTTRGAPLGFDTISKGVEALAAEGARATTHIVDGVEWLALHGARLSPDALPAPITDALKALGREAYHSPVTEEAEALPGYRCALSQRLRGAAEALPERVRRALDVVALRHKEDFLKEAEALERFCAACGCQARAETMFQTGCARQLNERPEAVAALLALPDRSVRAVGLEAIRLLAPAQARISDSVAAYASERYAEALTLESVADALGYNASYLGRVFREETGLGFRAWLNRYRVERAAALLKSTAAPVHQVADKVGYPQYKQFLAHFKEQYGLTPEQYRRE